MLQFRVTLIIAGVLFVASRGKFPRLFSPSIQAYARRRTSDPALLMKHASPRHKRALGNRIWRYRKMHQLTQEQVGVLLGHKKASQVSRWENGEKLPTLENALMLGHVLKVPLEALFADLATQISARVEARAAECASLGRGVKPL